MSRAVTLLALATAVSGSDMSGQIRYPNGFPSLKSSFTLGGKGYVSTLRYPRRAPHLEVTGSRGLLTDTYAGLSGVAVYSRSTNASSVFPFCVGPANTTC